MVDSEAHRSFANIEILGSKTRIPYGELNSDHDTLIDELTNAIEKSE